jgi:hypothetical protein
VDHGRASFLSLLKAPVRIVTEADVIGFASQETGKGFYRDDAVAWTAVKKDDLVIKPTLRAGRLRESVFSQMRRTECQGRRW